MYSDPGLSFATVVHLGELHSLRLQARSMTRFLSREDVAEILILVNDRQEAKCRLAVLDMLDEYGPLKERVRVLEGDDIFARPAGRWTFYTGLDRIYSVYKRRIRGKVGLGWRGYRGWHMQQAFKLASVRAATGSIVVSLDTKNFFIQPISRSDFVSGDGKGRMRFIDINPLQRKWVESSCKTLGLEPAPLLARSLPGYLTPFAVPSALLQMTLDTLERRHGPVQYCFALNPRTKYATEFMMIAAVAHHVMGGLENHFSDGAIHSVGTTGKSDVETIHRMLQSAMSEDCKVMAIHRRSWARFGQSEKNLFRQRPVCAGLLRETEKDAEFLENLMSQRVGA